MTKTVLDPLETSVKALSNAPSSIHIIELRFPNYRNLAPNTRLPFEFPITVLLGRNGSNKSSILHALYGCKYDHSLADFWFETEIDAIPAVRDGLKQSVTHTYVNKAGVEGECIKARAPRHKYDPDYWEAVKPSQRYGFPAGAKRVPPIDVPVFHLDFRGELPAFDKYFYFPDPAHLARRGKYARRKGRFRRGYRKQDYLRQRSKRLKNELEKDGTPLSTEELSILSYILERKYQSGTVLRHKLFHGHEGWTIVFRTPTVSGGYSDAFAGSGESAAALLVHNLISTPKGSLVLLDEPETSLHPRAQQRLLQFIAHYAVRKSLQIVMATHSIYLADKALPQAAIRVLESAKDDFIHVSTSMSASEAFHEIGSMESEKTLIVEDVRAKRIVLSTLKSVSPNSLKDIRVVVRDGGASRILRDIQAHATAGRSSIFVMFDGDYRPAIEVPDEDALPQGRHALDQLIKDLIKGPNKNGQYLDFVDAADRTRFISFFRTNVRFLPSTTPERLIWSDTAATNLLESFDAGDLPESIRVESDGKKQITALAELVAGMDADGVFQFLLAQFLRSESEERKQLEQTLRHVREA
ncbi:MAG: AAA family ATPase [Rhodopirellula sp.]|nr:AAA family ATPase [Rhodopirellula sp.]